MAARPNYSFRSFRQINRLTQSEVGTYLGCSKSFISQIETGRVDLPYESLQKLLNNDKGWDTSPLQRSLVDGYGTSSASQPHLLKEEDDDAIVESLEKLISSLQQQNEKLQEQNEKLQEQNEKSQAQIDRLLGMLEASMK